MKSISLFEHEKYEEDNGLSEKEKEFIEKNYRNQFSFTAKGIKAKQFVGVCQVDNKMIEVLPKIFKNEDQKDEQEKKAEQEKKSRQLLLKLLDLAGILEVEETEIAHLTKAKDNIFEILIYLFAKNLLSLLKKGVFKSYVEEKENLPYLRGKLNIIQQIRYNSFSQQFLFCEYSEFTENNLMNQIFKSCVKKLLPLTSTPENFTLLKKIDLILDDVEFHRFSDPLILQRVRFHRLKEHYQKWFNLAGAFLFGQSVQMKQGNLKSFAFMFDMNRLFEKSIFAVFKKYQRQLHLKSVKAQKQKELFDADSKCNDNFTLKP